MPQSRNINTYGDIKRQLEHCRALGGARIDFETFGQATVWMARAYTFRALLRKQDEELKNLPGYTPTTPWDDMVIRHDKKNRATFVVVEFNVAAKGIITALSGEESSLPIGIKAPNEGDDLLASIMSLAQAEGKK